MQAGDDCLVIFADMCMDAWWQNGGTGNSQERKRRHDVSDGFAILGPWSPPNVIADYNTEAAELRTLDGTTKMTLADGEATITATTINLNGNAIVDGSLQSSGSFTAQTAATFGGTTVIQGAQFLLHTHTGVTTGTDDTGPVL